jgi:eukaryotic-like serine/threonine-protein kinase
MAFNVLGFALASALTKDLEDRQRATQLSLLGGLMGNSPAGLLVVASAAQQDGGGTPPGPGPTRVAVPEVGEDIEGAKRILKARGLKASVVDVTDDHPIGDVLGSDPEAGTIVAVGSTVAVLVSAGLIVPDVVGEKQADGEAFIVEAGFVAVVEEAEDPGAKGLVQKQQPAGGSFLSAGSEVTLFVVGAEIEDEEKRSAGDGQKEMPVGGKKS